MKELALYFIVSMLVLLGLLSQEKGYGVRLLEQTDNKIQLGTQYLGEWNSTEKFRQFRFFEQFSGHSFHLFYHETEIETNVTSDTINMLIVKLLDPQYVDEKRATLVIPIQNIYKNNSEWKGIVTVDYFLYDGASETPFETGQTSANVIANEKGVEGTSEEFNFKITVKNRQTSKIFPLLIISPILVLFVLLEILLRRPLDQERISVITLSILINFLLYFGFVLIIIGINNIHSYFIICMLSGLVLIGCAVRVAYVFQNAIKRIHGVIGYVTFYLCSIGYLISLFLYYPSNYLVLLNSLWLVPQIIHNIRLGIKPKFNFLYIAAVILPQTYSFYFKGCPSNFKALAPNYSVLLTITALLIAQILILYGQNEFGNKFFIPKRFIPNHYDYLQNLEIDVNKPFKYECSVCLGTLKYEESGIIEAETQMVEQGVVEAQYKTVRIMKTPCNHMFHLICLKEWIQTKLNCPVCRTTLPAFESI